MIPINALLTRFLVPNIDAKFYLIVMIFDFLIFEASLTSNALTTVIPANLGIQPRKADPFASLRVTGIVGAHLRVRP